MEVIENIEDKTMLLRLSQSPIDIQEASNFVKDVKCGAIYLFLGTTRDLDETADGVSEPISSLFYESYPEMAIKLLEQVTKESLNLFPDVRKCFIHHRLGQVQVGEASIVIAASSTHRLSSHSMVYHCLEQIKQKVPVWKRVYFNDETLNSLWKVSKSEAFWLTQNDS